MVMHVRSARYAVGRRRSPKGTFPSRGIETFGV